MKDVFIKIGKGLLIALSGFLIGVLTVLGLRKKDVAPVEKVDIEKIEKGADDVKKKTKDFILRSPSHRIAGQYDGVGESIERGKKRFRDKAERLLQSSRSGDINE